MNERIEKLALECYQAPDFDYKKFTELIVRECLALTLGKDRRQLLDKGDLNGAHLVQRDIIRVIKHFGVEE